MFFILFYLFIYLFIFCHVILGQVENSETSKISEISGIFSDFFESKFSIFAMGQTRK